MPQNRMTMKTEPIDKNKLRAKVKTMGPEYRYQMLDEAIDLLPPTKLARLVKSYIHLDDLKPDHESTTGLLNAVKRFQKASLARQYFEAFDVNSKNCTQQSGKTQAWIADCKRLLRDCIKAVSQAQNQDARQGFDILFDLLRHIDRDPDSIIFFADEAGSWQVGCDWRTIMPAWFRCLSATADPEQYAAEVVRSVHDLVGHDHERHIAVARRVATREQRQALRNLEEK
jgi:hypothetical protein